MHTISRVNNRNEDARENLNKNENIKDGQKTEEPPYLNFNQYVLQISGAWREKPLFGIPFLPRISPFLLYVFIVYVFLFSGAILQLLESYNQLEIITETLSFLFAYGVCCHKLIYIIVYENKLKFLINLIKNNFHNPRQGSNPKHQSILLKTERENKLLTYLFGIFIIVCTSSINLYPITEWYFYKEPDPQAAANGTSTYVWRYPYRMVMPFDTSGDVAFWVMYAYHCTVGWLHIIVMPAADNLFIAFINHGYGQCLCLRDDLENLWQNALQAAGDPLPSVTEADGEMTAERGSRAARREYKRLLKESINHHLALIQYEDILEEMINKPMLFQFFTSTLILCSSAYQIIMFPTVLVKLVSMLALCFGESFHIFLYCFYANKIINETDSVGTSAYFSEWYEANPEEKKSLGILITRAQKEIRFTVGKFTELSLDTFTSVLKGSYTYLMLMIETK